MSHQTKSVVEVAIDSIRTSHRPDISPDCYFVDHPAGYWIVFLSRNWCSCRIQGVCEHRRRVARMITDDKLLAPSNT